MPPMNQIVVQAILSSNRRDENVLKQAKNLLTKSLGPVNKNLEGKTI